MKRRRRSERLAFLGGRLEPMLGRFEFGGQLLLTIRGLAHAEVPIRGDLELRFALPDELLEANLSLEATRHRSSQLLHGRDAIGVEGLQPCLQLLELTLEPMDRSPAALSRFGLLHCRQTLVEVPLDPLPGLDSFGERRLCRLLRGSQVLDLLLQLSLELMLDFGRFGGCRHRGLVIGREPVETFLERLSVRQRLVQGHHRLAVELAGRIRAPGGLAHLLDRGFENDPLRDVVRRHQQRRHTVRMVQQRRAMEEGSAPQIPGDQMGFERRTTAGHHPFHEVVPGAKLIGNDPIRQGGAQGELALPRAEQFDGGVVGGQDFAGGRDTHQTTGLGIEEPPQMACFDSLILDGGRPAPIRNLEA